MPVWPGVRASDKDGVMPMNKYEQIKAEFEQIADPNEASRMAAYMRDQFAFYGIPTPRRKLVDRAVIKTDKKNGSIDWVFLDQCYADDHREFQYVVMDYLTALQAMLGYEDIAKIYPYLKMKPWWDTVDGFDRIIGNIGLNDKRVDALMLAWSRDDDMWLRRIAIDHQLLRKERTNKELLEQIIVSNLGSREFFINKAIGWSLREYSKTDAGWVCGFLERHRTQMDKLSIREAGKYL